jgi:hypothetical protein
MNVHTYKKQVGGKGYYAEITFDVKAHASQPQIEIVYQADPEWEDVCRAGIKLFFDYFGRKSSESLLVTIYDIKWMWVDTNSLIVLFTTVEALCEALNIQIDGLQFDAVTEIFHFPERRRKVT